MRNDGYAQELGTLLQRNVRLVPGETETSFSRLGHFEMSGMGVIAASGSPCRISHPSANNSDVYAIWIRNGHCEVRHEGGHFDLSAGRFVVFRGSRGTELNHMSAFDLVGVRIEGATISRRLPCWDVIEFKPLLVHSASAQLMFGFADDLVCRGATLRPAGATAVFDAITQLLTDTLADEIGPHASTELAVARMRIEKFCQDNLMDPELSVEMISRALKTSPATLHRIFGGSGSTLMAWVRQARLNEAKLRLERLSDTSITDLALSLGFRDVSHFSRAFKSTYGKSPRMFRSEHACQRFALSDKA